MYSEPPFVSDRRLQAGGRPFPDREWSGSVPHSHIPSVLCGSGWENPCACTYDRRRIEGARGILMELLHVEISEVSIRSCGWILARGCQYFVSNATGAFCAAFAIPGHILPRTTGTGHSTGSHRMWGRPVWQPPVSTTVHHSTPATFAPSSQCRRIP